MPASSRRSGAFSPPPHSSGSTHGTNQKLNIVTRVAIEGKSKQGSDGASIKVYLKISLPVSSITPGSTIPLFPEENVKILDSQVHPLDNNSVPYNFSSTVSPLLHNAARTLNLQSRSSQSYISQFGTHTRTSSPAIGGSRSSPNGSNSAPLEDKYTGHILVSGYSVSYVLPKEFPPQYKVGGELTDSEGDEGLIRSTPMNTFQSRRGSIMAEKNLIQFMAGIDMWVPFLSQPPKAPYLLSIPIPRCLHNHIRLRIFPPMATATSASFASLSSAEDDSGPWDLAADPHVSRSATTHPTRSKSYSHFADDESSDSSTTGFADGCGIQGTFPSTDRIRVRWASPLKTQNAAVGVDGRRRVGVKEVRGEMVCLIRGKDPATDGAIVDVEYKGTCKGVWFPGVATLLGMDVALDVKGCKITWADSAEPKWSVSGSTGFTGFDIGPPSISRQSSLEHPYLAVSPASPAATNSRPSLIPHRSSAASLLRAPLPAQNVPDYSFENSPSLSGTVSSLNSLTPPSTIALDSGRSRRNSSSEYSPPGLNPQSTARPPSVPITLHINMNDLLAPSKNVFTFTVLGTIVVSPATSSNASSPTQSTVEGDADSIITLPSFRVLSADTEAIMTVVRNEVESVNVEVYNAFGDVRHAQTKKTVLQRGGQTKCGADGGRIALRPLVPSPMTKTEDVGTWTPTSRPRTPNGVRGTPAVPKNHGVLPISSQSKRDGPFMIPFVLATVTPLVNGSSGQPDACAVKACLSAPLGPDRDWLEFGFAQPSPDSSSLSLTHRRPPKVDVVSVTVDGVPVQFETMATVKGSHNELDGFGVEFEEMSGKEWISWLRLDVGSEGGNVEIVYLVSHEYEAQKNSKKGKERARETVLDVLLPTFSIGVGRMEVTIESLPGHEVSELQSNLMHRQQLMRDSQKLLSYNMPVFFYPRLSLVLHPSSSRTKLTGARHVTMVRTLWVVGYAIPTIMSLALLACVLSLGTELRQVKQTLDSYSTILGSNWADAEPITITSTLLRETSRHAYNSKWWFNDATPSQAVFPSSSTPTEPAHSAPYDKLSQSSSNTNNFLHRPNSPQESGSRSGDQFSLLPYNASPFSWLLRLDWDFPALDLNRTLETLGRFWGVLIRVFHYPLPP